MTEPTLTEPDPELPGVVDAGPAREAPPEPVNRSWIGSAAWYVVLTLLSLIVLLPIYFTARAGHLRPRGGVHRCSSVLTPHGRAVGRASARRATRATWARPCSAASSSPLLITGGQVFTSVLAAYAFAFLRFPFKRVVFAVFMATLLLPLEVTLLPNLQTMRDLGLVRQLPGADRAVRGRRLRHVPHPPGLPRHPRRDPRRDPPRGLGPPPSCSVRRAAHPAGDRLVHGHLVPRRLQPVPLAPGRHHRHRRAGPPIQIALRGLTSTTRSSPTSPSPAPSSPPSRSSSCSILFQRQIVQRPHRRRGEGLTPEKRAPVARRRRLAGWLALARPASAASRGHGRAGRAAEPDHRDETLPPLPARRPRRRRRAGRDRAVARPRRPGRRTNLNAAGRRVQREPGRRCRSRSAPRATAYDEVLQKFVAGHPQPAAPGHRLPRGHRTCG